MIRNKLLRVLNSDGNAIYVNDIADAYANWQSLASLFIKDSEHLFTGLQTSGRNVMFYENLAQMLYMVPEENNISGLTFGDIIIVTCAKNYILSRNSQVTFYIWLNTVTERTSENGTQYPAIVEALFSDEQPTGITEFNTLTLTATENIDLFILQNDYRANLLLPQSVSNVNLAQNAVSTTKILDGAVTSAKIADGTISSSDIADAAIIQSKIGAGAVGTSQLGNRVVDRNNIAYTSIYNEHLTNLCVQSANLGSLAVTEGKIANGAVTLANMKYGLFFSGTSYSSFTIQIIQKNATVIRAFNNDWAGTMVQQISGNKMSITFDIESGYLVRSIVFSKDSRADSINPIKNFEIEMSTFENPRKLTFNIKDTVQAGTAQFSLNINVIALVQLNSAV